ncbi:PREDICTED: ankyrin repeat domain-containing protein 13C [Tarenaya hassleriana]|uniref:ankyrin repeat domain-containing protein 13C n=1 Tax=Tarenaya hassleriana TaxID=28532 RepID=UPI00053C2ACD|nr:PREDICTED: ankyrin repeat domain-containing protein 13C [Tarenaya hassleriana]
MARPSSASAAAKLPAIKPEDYAHSPVHYAVVLGDHASLTRLVSSLPKLADPEQIRTESDSLSQERVAERISSVLDRRDVTFRETPLHLAVRLNDVYAARTIASAGADISLQNAAGWNPLQEALCRRNSEVTQVLLRHHHRLAWCKWRRRLPRLIAVLHRMRDFYMEMSFHFESSVIPFVGKIAPSDTYKIWKRDGNLRADTSLAGFDGLKIQRADQSFLFLGDGDESLDISPGSLLVLNRDDRKIFDAFESAGAPISDPDIAGFCSQSSVYRPGMDVTKAELVGRTNWRRQEKTESVGEWKAKVYEVQNVTFSFRSRKVIAGENDVAGSEQVLPLELDEDDDGFLVAENPSFLAPVPPPSTQPARPQRRHSSFVREDRDWISVGRQSVDVYPSAAQFQPPRRSISIAAPSTVPVAPPPQTKEKEFVKSLRPSVWLTDHFPLKTEDLLPLLDILASKVKAVRRMRELLTTKFPPGTFPVKLSIPVVPTVKVVITFTKFVDLPPLEQFYTPLSSPSLLLVAGDEHSGEEDSRISTSRPSFSASSWLRRSSSQSVWKTTSTSSKISKRPEEESDPFVIPSGYKWTSIADKSGNNKMKRSKSTRRSK